MPIPSAITGFNKRYLNKVTVHLAGHGYFVELEHVGRRSGTRFHTPLMAFRDGAIVTIALTYGPDVDWLRNLRAAGGGRMHIGRALLSLGAPAEISRGLGLSRMPLVPKAILPIMGGDVFVELPVLTESIFSGWSP
ncbi:MAG: nitroreductase family deazaflavin-dependent oxidoreductase [Micrococcales bacterium]|nr:nitroreductase family deazaflavin-dependent oxidoreductase [Micrococcales bacterium]